MLKVLEPGVLIRWNLFPVETFGLSLVIEIHMPLIWIWLSRILTDMQCPLTAHEATLVKKHAHSFWHRACIASIIDSCCFLRILQPWVQSITKCYFYPALLIGVQTGCREERIMLTSSRSQVQNLCWGHFWTKTNFPWPSAQHPLEMESDSSWWFIIDSSPSAA